MLCGQFLAIAPLLLSIVSAQGTFVVTANSKTVTCTRFKQTGFWDVDIQNWSMPKECGPPLAYNAIRDKSKLPAQIAGLVGAYVFFLAAVGSLLLTWGRRMRKNVERATGQLKEIEMINKSDYGLASPAPSQKSWRHPFKGLKHFNGSNSTVGRHTQDPKSPGMESVQSFDDRILERNRESAQQEMDRLYAAVAAHEEARRSQTAISKVESRDSLRSAAETDRISVAPKAAVGDGRKNLRVQISEVPPHEIPNGPISPRSPSSMHSTQGAPKSPYRAIYPPYPSPGQFSYTNTQPPMTPITPRTPYTPGLQRVQLENDMYPASPPPKQVRMQIPPPSSSSSNSSSKSKKISQLKSLRIGHAEDMNAEDRQPLSPMAVTPAGAPQGYNEPMSARTFNTIESDDYASERLDEPKPLPSSRPTLHIALPSSPKPGSQRPMQQAPAGGNLALRAFQNQAVDYPLSPGPVKQTILERKPDRVGRGPMTGRTPRTGVPMTPYTPYMPFTPITPVTPGLMSRKMRKERIKAEGRKVLVEEDEVADGEEMWQG